MWLACGALRAWARSPGARACGGSGGVPYTQGQSPEPRTREYFYYVDHQGQLFLDDSKMKNFTTCFKEVHPIAGHTVGRLVRRLQLLVHGQSRGRWPQGRPHYCCCHYCWCPVSHSTLPDAPPPAAATAPQWSVALCGCASSHLDSHPGRRRCSCRTTASRTWSQASWRPSLPCAISTCTTTACVPWSQAPSARSHACWSWHSQATGYMVCASVLSLAWPSCVYSTWLVTSWCSCWISPSCTCRTPFPDGLLSLLQRLQELHLQENSIELLEDQALAGLSSLALLDLSRNQLGTISREALQPLASLQVLRLTGNPWRCDCALHWLGAWIKEDGQRLLSSRDKKITCAEPPRLALQSLLDVSGSSLICIPPSVHVEPLEVTANLGEDLRVACQASGYPQPLVTWRKLAQPREGQPRAQAQPEGGVPGPGAPAAPDTGSGMLFLANITLAHAGKYECEASNAGGAARVPFQLLVNLSRPPPPPPPAAGREPLHEAGSLAFRALGLATQAAVAAAIALLALTALLLAALIFRGRRGPRAPGPPGEGALFVNDYSDGPCTFAQLEELRGERGHEMFVIDRSKLLLADRPAARGTRC
uniref:Leucine rich repeat containing 24 n=1 Tax=Equus asinus TaxID=9793 RepID=A0A9L0J3E7_EQUAS